MGHVLGTEKGHFLIRGRRAAMAKWRPRRFNPVNPCQICLPGVAWGRYYTRASAYTAWAAASSIFGRFLSAAHGVLAVLGHGLLPRLSESTRLLHRWRMRDRHLPTTRPTPRDLQEPTCPRKKCVIWTRWRLVPVKNVNYPRGPSSRRSGLVGPHTTPAIVNYK
jgi:hypothetical protein